MPLQLSFDNLDEPEEESDGCDGDVNGGVQQPVHEGHEPSIAERFSEPETAEPTEKRAKKTGSLSDAFSGGQQVVADGGSEARQHGPGRGNTPVSSDEVPHCRRSCFNCLYGTKDQRIPERAAVCSKGHGYVIPDADRKGGECGWWVLSEDDTYTYYIKKEETS